MNPGAEVRGMGILMWVCCVCRHISWCRTYEVMAVPWFAFLLHSSDICSSSSHLLCRFNRDVAAGRDATTMTQTGFETLELKN